MFIFPQYIYIYMFIFSQFLYVYFITIYICLLYHNLHIFILSQFLYLYFITIQIIYVFYSLLNSCGYQTLNKFITIIAYYSDRHGSNILRDLKDQLNCVGYQTMSKHINIFIVSSCHQAFLALDLFYLFSFRLYSPTPIYQ